MSRSSILCTKKPAVFTWRALLEMEISSGLFEDWRGDGCAADFECDVFAFGPDLVVEHELEHHVALGFGALERPFVGRNVVEECALCPAEACA